MAYRSMEWFGSPVSGGITGGMTSGVTYLSTVVGSSVPLGSTPQARWETFHGTNRAAPPTAPALRT